MLSINIETQTTNKTTNMKKQTNTPEQVNRSYQKRINSSDFKATSKRIIESLRIFNNTRSSNPLTKREIRDLAFSFAIQNHPLTQKTKEKTGVEAVLDNLKK